MPRFRGTLGPGLAVTAVLAAAAAGGPLRGQALLLRLRPEEAAILQLPQNPGVLYRRPETVDQALRAFALAGGDVCHAKLLTVPDPDYPGYCWRYSTTEPIRPATRVIAPGPQPGALIVPSPPGGGLGWGRSPVAFIAVGSRDFPLTPALSLKGEGELKDPGPAAAGSFPNRSARLSPCKAVILSEAKNLTHDRETLRSAQGDNEKTPARRKPAPCKPLALCYNHQCWPARIGLARPLSH